MGEKIIGERTIGVEIVPPLDMNGLKAKGELTTALLLREPFSF